MTLSWRLALAVLAAATLRAAPLSNLLHLDPSGSVALDASGRVFTWGPQFLKSNQLQPVNYPAPRLAAESAAFRKIARGRGHFLALRADGTVCSWGVSSLGALGLGPGVDSAAACTTIPGLSGVTDIVASDNASQALKADGTLWAWGSLHSSVPAQWLDNTVAMASRMAIRTNGTVWSWAGGTLTEVSGLTSAVSGARSRSGTRGFAVRQDGSLWTWLTDGAATPVTGLPAPVTAVAAGPLHALALLSNGSLWAWGDNKYGQLGTGDNTPSNVPIPVPGFSGGVHSLAAGETHSAALMNDGTLRTWGGNYYGDLGIGTASQPYAGDSIPAPIPGLTSVRAVAAGDGFSLALRTDGTVWSWGHGPRLGVCATPSRDRPAATAITGAAAISARDKHALAVLNNGTVTAWGANGGSQLGDGTTTDRCAPAPVPGITGITAAAAGDDHSLALKSDGSVWAWGGFSTAPPAQVPTLSGVQSIAAGQMDSFGILTNGSLFQWVRASATTPSLVSGLPPVSQVAAGSPTFHLALDTSGGVWRLDPATPIRAHFDSGVASVANDIPPVAIKTDGTVWAWNAFSADPPSQVRGLTGVQSMAARNGVYLALMNDGTVRSWGTNEFGQLGRGASGLSFNRTSPVTVQSLPVVPNPGAATPASGSGVTQTFTFQFEHSGGASSIAIANVLLNNALDARNACYIAYLPSGPSSGIVVLVNDAGQAGGPFAGSLAIPGNGAISNSQCTINATGSSAVTSGARLTLTLNMSFTQAFAGGRTQYLAVRDSGGGNSGWVPQGAWSVPLASPPAQTIQPATISASTVSAGSAVDLTVVHAAGASNFEIVNLLINQAVDGSRACYLAYVASTNSILLVNDAGEAGGPFAGSIAIGTPGAIGNSQCVVFGTDSSAIVSANTLRLRLHFRLSDGANPWIVYAAARDRLGNNTGWHPLGVAGPH